MFTSDGRVVRHPSLFKGKIQGQKMLHVGQHKLSVFLPLFSNVSCTLFFFQNSGKLPIAGNLQQDSHRHAHTPCSMKFLKDNTHTHQEHSMACHFQQLAFKISSSNSLWFNRYKK
jgi:hypothetical protein